MTWISLRSSHQLFCALTVLEHCLYGRTVILALFKLISLTSGLSQLAPCPNPPSFSQGICCMWRNVLISCVLLHISAKPFPCNYQKCSLLALSVSSLNTGKARMFHLQWKDLTYLIYCLRLSVQPASSMPSSLTAPGWERSNASWWKEEQHANLPVLLWKKRNLLLPCGGCAALSCGSLSLFCSIKWVPLRL